MESIQVTKGSGSVINGYESTTGQINIELLKPDNEETPRFYLNLFRELNGNSEINTHYKKEVSKNWSSILMLHGNYMGREMTITMITLKMFQQEIKLIYTTDGSIMTDEK